jgi:hypothetical protein
MLKQETSHTELPHQVLTEGFVMTDECGHVPTRNGAAQTEHDVDWFCL